MRFLFFIVSVFLACCQSKINDYNLIVLKKFEVLDSIIFSVPKTVQLNQNTHVKSFISNDSLCIVNLSSGKNDPHLYIYHLKQRKLWNQLSFNPILNIKDFKIIDKSLFILVNNYHEKRSIIYQYDLVNCLLVDSCILYENKLSGHIYVNAISSINDSKIIFTLKTFKNPPIQFPLVGYYDIKSKELKFTKTWYPFIKDKSNDVYFMHSMFKIDNNHYISYATTPYLSMIENEDLKTIKTGSVILNHLYNNNLENVIVNNCTYLPEVNVITINNRDYILRQLVPDEKILGYNISVISLYDNNFNCIGEQVEEYFKNREDYLQKTFTQKHNDSINISCYVYHNVLKIKFGKFSTYYRSLSEYVLQLDSLKKIKSTIQNEACYNVSDYTVQTSSLNNNICNFKKFLKQKDSLLLKENIIVLSLNTCPACIKEFLEWYFSKYSLVSSKNTLLITYKNSKDLEIIKDIYNRYPDYFKQSYQMERFNLLPFLDLTNPFLYVENIAKCEKARILKYESSEIDSFKNIVFKNSVVVIE